MQWIEIKNSCLNLEEKLDTYKKLNFEPWNSSLILGPGCAAEEEPHDREAV